MLLRPRTLCLGALWLTFICSDISAGDYHPASVYVAGDFLILEENIIKTQQLMKMARYLLLSRLLSQGYQTSLPPRRHETTPSPYPPPLCEHPESLLYFASWYPCKGGSYPRVAEEMARPGHTVHPQAEMLQLRQADKPMLSPAGVALTHTGFILAHWDRVCHVWVTLATLKLLLLQHDAAARCCYLQLR